MNKLILAVFFIFVTISASSQIKFTSQAIKLSDSILQSKVCDSLQQYFSISTGSYYEYLNKKSYRIGKFLSKKRLPDKYVSLHFLYHFNYPFINGVRGSFWLIVDNKSQLQNAIDLSFIPDFLIENKPSNFISVDSALVIAKGNFKEKGYEITPPILSYDEKLKHYKYQIWNKLKKTIPNTRPELTEIEIVDINALNGRIDNLIKSYYPLIIR